MYTDNDIKKLNTYYTKDSESVTFNSNGLIATLDIYLEHLTAITKDKMPAIPTIVIPNGEV